MKPHRPEREIQKAITEYLKARGVLCFRMNTGAVTASYKGRTRFVKFGYPGMADILAFPKGKPATWIEVKASDGRMSVFQEGFSMLVKMEGHRYIVARSVSDVEKEL